MCYSNFTLKNSGKYFTNLKYMVKRFAQTFDQTFGAGLIDDHQVARTRGEGTRTSVLSDCVGYLI